MADRRTEVEIVKALSPDEQRLLKRVLEIERAKLHLTAADPSEDIAAVVREIHP